MTIPPTVIATVIATAIATAIISPVADARPSERGHVLEAAPQLEALSLPALSESERAALLEIRADPKPKEIVRNSHYWVSNEHNHQLWLPFIKELGGAHVGVGTDQNYLLAAWSRASLLILMDFDVKISETHQLYMYFFSISATPDDFMKRWHKSYAQDTLVKLTEHMRAHGERVAAQEAARKQLNESKSEAYVKRRARQYVKNYTRIYKLIRPIVWRRLSKTIRKYKKINIPTFLTDQASYDHIRSLVAGGRVIAMRGDLTADQTSLDIARALRKLNTPLNVLYLSNAEQYFNLPPSYRRNIIAQPWGERSVALRTMSWGGLKFYDEKEQYHYNVQSGASFVDWLARSRTSKAGRIIARGGVVKEKGFSVIEKPPIISKRAPKVAPIPDDLR